MDLTQANLTSVKTVRFVFRPMYWDMSSWIDEIDLNATPVDATAPAARSQSGCRQCNHQHYYPHLDCPRR